MYEKGAIRMEKSKYLSTNMKMEATKEEVLAAYANIEGNWKFDGMIEISPKMLAQHLNEQNIKFDAQFLKLLLEHCDTDGDGHVSREEFIAFVDKYYRLHA